METSYTALRQRCGLWRRMPRSGLILTGEDRHRLLHGLVTCEVKALEPGQGARGFFTDAKGHILAPVVVRASEDHLWLELPLQSIAAIADHIRNYIVADRVEVLEASFSVPLTLVGPTSTDLLAAVSGSLDLPGSWNHRSIEIAGETLPLTTGVELGVPAFTLWTPEDAVESLTRALCDPAASAGTEIVDKEAVEIVRVEEGAPRFDRDYDSENLPQETGLEDAVSYTKGCFLGQEVVARLHYRGQVARQVARLAVEGAEPAVRGAVLVLEEREAGRITSAVRRPTDGRVTALAMLPRRALDPGTVLSIVGGGEARVG
jgi:folate-binding protein YgfZ